jgi:hypothetical protein
VSILSVAVGSGFEWPYHSGITDRVPSEIVTLDGPS